MLGLMTSHRVRCEIALKQAIVRIYTESRAPAKDEERRELMRAAYSAVLTGGCHYYSAHTGGQPGVHQAFCFSNRAGQESAPVW